MIGKRFHSAPVIRLADAKEVHLGHILKGGWSLAHFRLLRSGQIPPNRLRALELCAIFLPKSPKSPVRRYTPAWADIDSVIDVRAVFQQGHRELHLEAMPAFLFPRKGRHVLRDYEKMFCPDLKSGNNIFYMRGVDREQGCMIVVRPDQYVAHVLPIDAFADLSAFFGGFMLEKN